ncbi:Hypothetical transmembrane protein [Flavobacterium indicum GPTSA100-9 = DSM 17447]|uniref:Hypothetical transmembrane protein n=1 Tax=Flavobacterium indicum (strain DSM 17447 / CIP 109464 / GPTSA100-9) TaxID=1094466 RepID=H8XVV0_FLAIG|nr:hypothetical protein [Flavobacterium indicum]CCG54064.1 Hypothetical transmembrane protein [Flavobacterium indicum GPTSA100-9 = DSM 17447]
MNKKDINFEVERFLKGNYQKSVALELLRKDGFSEEEIQQHAHKFDQLRKNPDNSLSYFPPFLFLVLASITSLTLTLKEEIDFKPFFLVLFLFTITTTYFFSKKNKTAIIATAFLTILSMLLLVYLYIISFLGLGKLLLIELFLILALFSVKRFYTKIAKS